MSDESIPNIIFHNIPTLLPPSNPVNLYACWLNDYWSQEMGFCPVIVTAQTEKEADLFLSAYLKLIFAEDEEKMTIGNARPIPDMMSERLGQVIDMFKGTLDFVTVATDESGDIRSAICHYIERKLVTREELIASMQKPKDTSASE